MPTVPVFSKTAASWILLY